MDLDMEICVWCPRDLMNWKTVSRGECGGRAGVSTVGSFLQGCIGWEEWRLIVNQILCLLLGPCLDSLSWATHSHAVLPGSWRNEENVLRGIL